MRLAVLLLSFSAKAEIVLHPGYNYTAIKEKYQGPVLPALTNYLANLSLDLHGIHTNIDTVVSRGLTSGNAVILAAAAGGDFPRLTTAQRKMVIDTQIKAVNGRAPVIVSVQNSDVAEMVELARYAEEAGADAVQVSPPFYYPCTLEDFNRTLTRVMAATKKCDILIYNTPWEYNPSQGTAMDLQYEDIVMLANAWPRFVLLKWASTSNRNFQKVVTKFRDRLAIIDNYGMWPTTYMQGGTGMISHFANVWPEWNVMIHKMLKAGKYEEAHGLISTIYWPWYEFRAKMGGRTAVESVPVKGALDLLEGRIGGPAAEPSRKLNQEEIAELKALLKKIGVPGVK